ncbi:hypothetical protein RTBOTA2_004204 [Rhodotorula toruloides]|nr:hypothetical protein RTBOTA2_004204 [Rhodotorula toruloides]
MNRRLAKHVRHLALLPSLNLMLSRRYERDKVCQPVCCDSRRVFLIVTLDTADRAQRVAKSGGHCRYECEGPAETGDADACNARSAESITQGLPAEYRDARVPGYVD